MTKEELFSKVTSLYNEIDDTETALLKAREKHNAADELVALCRFGLLTTNIKQMLTILVDYINEHV